jgi:hypothetical protein
MCPPTGSPPRPCASLLPRPRSSARCAENQQRSLLPRRATGDLDASGTIRSLLVDACDLVVVR